MKPFLKSAVLLVLMLIASGLALALRPSHRISAEGPSTNLEAMIPKEFGAWRLEPANSVQIVDPQQKALLDRLYTQTLTRTYISTSGYRVMLSIAYGEDQTDTNQVHRPEVCYPSQGFVLNNKRYGLLEAGNKQIPITRLETTLGQRHEPITYWITVGTKVVGPGLDKKLTELGYGLNGKIPDGLLFRISSIDNDVARAYRAHESFAAELYPVLDTDSQRKLFGTAPGEKQ